MCTYSRQHSPNEQQVDTLIRVAKQVHKIAHAAQKCAHAQHLFAVEGAGRRRTTIRWENRQSHAKHAMRSRACVDVAQHMRTRMKMLRTGEEMSHGLNRSESQPNTGAANVMPMLKPPNCVSKIHTKKNRRKGKRRGKKSFITTLEID